MLLYYYLPKGKYYKHFQNKNPIAILQDSDPDGILSTTVMYKYIKEMDPDYDVRVYIHKNNKSHGLDAHVFDIDKDIKLLIIPDAASNDIEEHFELHDMGIDCLIADHHQVTVDVKNSPAVILNNQTSSNYTNKDCCGTSITLEFCRALDEFYWNDISDYLIDLAGVANLADVMSISNFGLSKYFRFPSKRININLPLREKEFK